MFADAMEQAMDYCRPIKIISRVYKSDEVLAETFTMFFVNGEGIAITSKHIAEEIMRGGKLNRTYEAFRKERASIPEECNHRIETNRLERRYEYVKGETKTQLRYSFSRCFDRIEKLGIEAHPFYDLAVIRFGGFGTTMFRGHCVFSKEMRKPRVGMSVCRLGYPVTEFDDYAFVREKDDIVWTATGTHTVSQYPAEGMIVHVTKNDERITTFEVSGIVGKGYCGAPVLDKNGILVGMVMDTVTRIVDGQPKTCTLCVNAEIIKSFLQEKGIRFFEE